MHTRVLKHIIQIDTDTRLQCGGVVDGKVAERALRLAVVVTADAGQEGEAGSCIPFNSDQWRLRSVLFFSPSDR